jgi:hypothetical protein
MSIIKFSNGVGLTPEDLLVAGAISAGIADVRKKPWLLDFCFSWLYNDELSKSLYGEKEIEAIKRWFSVTDIFVSPVTMKMDVPQFPLVTVHLDQATEDRRTIGDVHYNPEDEVPGEEVQVNPQKILGPLNAIYDSETGIVTIPEGQSSYNIFAGCLLVDKHTNIAYPIVSVQSTTEFTIEPGQVANFTGSWISPFNNLVNVSLESITYRHSYSIRVFTQDPKELMHLSMIIRFILMRYKQEYLEKRGLESSSFQYGGMYNASEIFGGRGGEFIFGQNVSLVGLVTETFPKGFYPKIQGLVVKGLMFETTSESPSALLGDLEAQGWSGEPDDI